MAYFITRMQKIKSSGIKGIAIHNQRLKTSKTNPDIDRTRTELNYDFVKSDQTIDKRIKMRVSMAKNYQNLRKDAVFVNEFVITSDHETMTRSDPEAVKQLFERTYRWFVHKYGMENIPYATVHLDERTPHLHLGLIPITKDGRLCSNDLFGKKEQMNQFLDQIFKDVASRYDCFERCKSKDEKAKHLDMMTFKIKTAHQTLSNLEKEQSLLQDQIKELDGQVIKLKKAKSKDDDFFLERDFDR